MLTWYHLSISISESGDIPGLFLQEVSYAFNSYPNMYNQEIWRGRGININHYTCIGSLNLNSKKKKRNPTIMSGNADIKWETDLII